MDESLKGFDLNSRFALATEQKYPNARCLLEIGQHLTPEHAHGQAS